MLAATCSWAAASRISIMGRLAARCSGEAPAWSRTQSCTCTRDALRRGTGAHADAKRLLR